MKRFNVENQVANRTTSKAILAIASVSVLAIGAVFAADDQKSAAKSGRKSTEAPSFSRGKLGQDLFMAVGKGDLKGAKQLLKNGADPNSRNGLDFVPLYIAAASHQLEMMKTLISGNAKPDAESPYGTALTFASATGHTAGVSLLISKGANVNYIRVDGMTPLMMAASAGAPDTVAELIKNKANVNTKNYSGATALAYAARGGNTAAGQVLLKNGAAVDTRDAIGETPLMSAAKTGRTDFVKLLLSKGAKVNVKDNQGRTPLALATTYGDYPEVVKALQDAGADVSIKDAKGRTANAMATKHGYQQSALALDAPSANVMKLATESDAIAKSLILLQASMKDFGQKTACLSCHHEGLGRMATALAKDRGFKVDPALQQSQAGRLKGATTAMLPLHSQALKSPEAMKQLPLIEINEVSAGYSWLLAGMASQKDSATPGTAAIASVLARLQSPEGNWSFSMPRVPMQSSLLTTTALSVKSLLAYAPKADVANTAKQVEKAKEWMLKSPAKVIDDFTFRLLGLKWAGATAEERKASVDQLLAQQQADGGWAQVPGMHSDAYATGQAVYALLSGGELSTSNPAVKKGLEFLVRTQDDDGSWFVNKRAMPANNYFPAAFPHGESQYSSFNGTAWAMMALLESLPKK